MARPAPTELDEDTIPVPRAVRFPVELDPPDGFYPERPETWPRVEGRLEWVEGRLLYMPPCGDRQHDTVADLVAELVGWVRAHPDFVVGTNEAGMILPGGVRGADGAVWRRADVGTYSGGYRRVPPLLAAEVAGRDEPEPVLRQKADWYLARGVVVVWILLPAEREVIVVERRAERRLGIGDTLPRHDALPDLTPAVANLFRQVVSAARSRRPGRRRRPRSRSRRDRARRARPRRTS